MASIRLNEEDKTYIEIIQAKIPELKTESAVFKFCLKIIASAYETVEPKLVINEVE